MSTKHIIPDDALIEAWSLMPVGCDTPLGSEFVVIHKRMLTPKRRERWAENARNARERALARKK